MRTNLRQTATALAAALTAAAVGLAGPAAGAEPHTFSGTLVVPVWVPPDTLPSFTLELEEQTVDSRQVAGGGVLTISFAGSLSEPAAKTQTCPGRGHGARLRLSGLSAGAGVSATYTPAGGETVSTPVVVVPGDGVRVTAAVCT